MARLSTFNVDDLERCSRALRVIGDGAADMAGAASRITSYLFEELKAGDGQSACVSVTIHNTRAFRQLPRSLADLALEADADVTPDTMCLTRLAAAGHSGGERPGSLVLPLTEAAFRAQPILPAMLTAMGLDPEVVTDPAEAVSRGIHRDELRSFHVPDLVASPWLSADARQTLGDLDICSLLGLGGGLPTGDLFLLFLFTREPIPERTASLLRSLSPAVKASLIPFALRPWGGSRTSAP